MLDSRYYCDASYCDDGVYYPDYCRSTELDPNEPPCAVLLAEYPGNDIRP